MSTGRSGKTSGSFEKKNFGAECSLIRGSKNYRRCLFCRREFLIGLFLMILSFLIVLSPVHFSKTFSLGYNGWEFVSELPSGVTSFYSSLAGDTYAFVNNRIFKSSLSGWQEVSKHKLVGQDYSSLGIAASNEELWTYGKNGAAFLIKDSEWVFYPISTDCVEPRDLLVNSHRVLISCTDNKLLWLTDGEWQVENLKDSLPEIDWTLPRSFTLAFTSDGSLWLKDKNIWRKKGDQWSLFNIDKLPEHFSLIGEIDGYLWLAAWEWPKSWRSTLSLNHLLSSLNVQFLAFTLTENANSVYSPVQTLAAPADMVAYSLIGNRFYVLADDRLLIHEQGVFIKKATVPPWPLKPLLNPIDFTFDQKNHLTAMMILPLWISWLGLIPALLALALAIRTRSVMRREAIALKQFHRDTIDTLVSIHKTSSGQVKPSTGISIVGFDILTIIFIILALFIIEKCLPDLHYLIDLIATMLAIAISLVALLFIIARVERWVRQPYKKNGSFENSLLRIELLTRIKFPLALLHKMELLVEGGCLDEAKTTIEECLAKEKKPSPYTGILLELLGWVSLGLGDYAKADKCFDAALDFGLPVYASYYGLAVSALLQAKEPTQALSHLEAAIKSKKQFHHRLIALIAGSSRLREMKAASGWALALMGEASKAESVMPDAFAMTDQNDFSNHSLLHYYAAETKSALGDKTEARQLFRRVMEISRDGIGARFANNSLRKLSAL
jgi:tetratricopeptide (TPR) repeat protein